MNLLLLIIAFVCAILYTFGVHIGNVSMLGLTLIFFIGSFIFAGAGYVYHRGGPVA